MVETVLIYYIYNKVADGSGVDQAKQFSIHDYSDEGDKIH